MRSTASVDSAATSDGITTAAAPRGTVVAARNALATASAALSGWATSAVYLVMGVSIAAAFID